MGQGAQDDRHLDRHGSGGAHSQDKVDVLGQDAVDRRLGSGGERRTRLLVARKAQALRAAILVLALAKFWEGYEGDDILRRFVMLVAGLSIGVGAFAACDMLMVRLSTKEMFNVLELPSDVIPTGIYASDGTPGLTPFLAYFATLFLVLRWWRQVDPLRKSRFSLWATIVCALVAMLIPWQIPWGFNCVMACTRSSP